MPVTIHRIHLKTNTQKRAQLIDWCLTRKKQYIAIGWSYLYKIFSINSYDDFYKAAKDDCQRINAALNIFKNTKENDLFWTRDLNGFYWVCRAKGLAIPVNQTILTQEIFLELDIGAVIPVEAYKYGMQIPGNIKASFNKAQGGISQKFYDDLTLLFSEHAFNTASKKKHYKINEAPEFLQIKCKESFLHTLLPPLDLEELVISYIQINYNYYLLSGSIANKSTTIKIEAEFISRNPKAIEKAVVQVKNRTLLDASNYTSFTDAGYKVFLYSNNGVKTNENTNIIVIQPSELKAFYENYKSILSKSITQYENIFDQFS